MQRNPVSIRTILRWTEYAYAATLLFVLTQGPVLSVWFASEQQNLKPALAPQLATYFLVQIPALVLVSRQKFTLRDVHGPLGLLGLFCIWLTTTTLWATNGQHSAVESVSLLTTFICGVYFAKRFTLIEKLTIAVVAMQPGLVLSRYAIAHNWELSKSAEGHWVGIYFNRNSLAPVAIVSFVCALTLVFVVFLNKNDKFRFYKLCVLANIVLFALVVVARTRSNTPFGGLIAFVGIFMFWELLRRSSLRRFLQQDKHIRSVVAIFFALVALCSWLAIQLQSKVLGLFGETVSFNGRSEIWKYSWNGFLDKPFQGWGWLSAWRSWAFMRMDLWWTVEGVTWSHNAFLDVLLGGGVFAVGLLIAAIVWGVYRLTPTDTGNPIDSWSVSFVFFFLAMCTQESFIIGNHFLWLLFVAVLTSGTTTSRQPKQSLVA
jgi:exopolysaccharide production protein ExoQ